jgi:hypothetical protein
MQATRADRQVGSFRGDQGDSTTRSFFHSEKIRNLVADGALLLHRFSLSSVRAVLYTGNNVSIYSVIPA